MSLANLTLRGMERYGAIELKRNADTFVTKGFIASLSLVSVLLLTYFLLPAEQEEKVIQLIRRFAEIGPPPTLTKEQLTSAGFTAPSTPIRSTFGIPVPVPDLEAPKMTMPDINAPTLVPGLALKGTGGIISGPPVILPGTSKPDPEPITDPDNPDVFVPVDETPVMINDLESFIVYPEIAKRSGLEGRVLISALVNEEGIVTRTRIEQADYEVFSQAAVDAVMKLKFKPALQGKEPVKLWVTIPISFKLRAK